MEDVSSQTNLIIRTGRDPEVESIFKKCGTGEGKLHRGPGLDWRLAVAGMCPAMTGFAGSRSLDERRRRRLATGSETVPLEAVAEPAPRRAPAEKRKRARRGSAHFPLRKVISIRYWKLAAVILGAAVAGAGILVGGWAAATHGEQLGPGFVLMFRLDAARLVRGFAAVGLMLAGQLALLISWARSQSLQDFSGRYRGWVFCAILAFVAAIGLETQLTAAWSATATWLWPTPFVSAIAQRAILLWLVPTIICGLFAHAYLVREMRDCRLSLTFLWLAFFLGGGAAAILIARPLPFPEPRARLVECGVALAFVICVFSSLLLHARHVVYVCVDPPTKRPSRAMAALRWLRPWALFKRRGANSGNKRSRQSAGGDIVASVKRRTPRRPRSATKAPPPELSPEPSSESRRAPAPPASIKSTPAKPSVVDPRKAAAANDVADEEENSPASSAGPGGAFAGMSRRERRLLKKQMRADRAPLRRSA